jgi:hypothetical protein
VNSIRTFSLVGGAALALLPALQAGALFIPTADARFVDSYYESFCPGCGPEGEDEFFSDSDSDAPAVPFAPFDASVEAGSSWTASQSSTVASTLLAGVGQAGTSTGETGNASSIYDITFDVDVATPYKITGVLDNQSSGLALTFQLFEGSNVLYEVDGGGVFGTTPLSNQDVLAPGTYRLLVQASFAGAGAGDQASYSFEFGQVPEPGTGLLVMLGLSVLSLRRTRGCAARDPSRE